MFAQLGKANFNGANLKKANFMDAQLKNPYLFSRT